MKPVIKTQRADHYKVKLFFNGSNIIIINDKTIKNYYDFTHIAAASILLNLSL